MCFKSEYIILSLIEEIFRAFYYDNELIKDAPLIRWGTKDTETATEQMLIISKYWRWIDKIGSLRIDENRDLEDYAG